MNRIRDIDRPIYTVFAWLPGEERWMHVYSTFDKSAALGQVKIYAESPTGKPRMVIVVERPHESGRLPLYQGSIAPTWHPYAWPHGRRIGSGWRNWPLIKPREEVISETTEDDVSH